MFINIMHLLIRWTLKKAHHSTFQMHFSKTNSAVYTYLKGSMCFNFCLNFWISLRKNHDTYYKKFVHASLNPSNNKNLRWFSNSLLKNIFWLIYLDSNFWMTFWVYPKRKNTINLNKNIWQFHPFANKSAERNVSKGKSFAFESSLKDLGTF